MRLLPGSVFLWEGTRTLGLTSPVRRTGLTPTRDPEGEVRELRFRSSTASNRRLHWSRRVWFGGTVPPDKLRTLMEELAREFDEALEERIERIYSRLLEGLNQRMVAYLTASGTISTQLNIAADRIAKSIRQALRQEPLPRSLPFGGFPELPFHCRNLTGLLGLSG